MGIGEIGELLRRSTVQIRGMHPRRPSSGSGLIWDRDGTILTNAHVLGPGDHIVEFWDGRTFAAKVEDRDEQRDVAKIRVPATGLSAAEFRFSAVRPGELVVAVGNPLGFTGAMTSGVVHAAGPVDGLGRRAWVQAAIRLAPGNSGGPLADAAGQVVGMNTMIMGGGLALAVPSAAIADFVRDGARPRIGVTVQQVRLPRPRRWGLLVMGIEAGSPAEQASLMIGDILTNLSDALEEAEAGAVRLRFLRGDRKRERQAVLVLQGKSTREAA